MSETNRNIPLWMLAWRNARRNQRRTILTALSVLVAVGATVFMLSYMGGVTDNMLDTYARTESGHIRVRQMGYAQRARSLPLHLFVPNLDTVLSAVEKDPHVKRALPRIRTMALVDDAASNRPGMLFGLDLTREEGYFNPSAMLVSGRLPRPGASELMIGTLFAEEMKIGVGDTLTLIGQTSYRSLGGMRGVVTGIGTTGLGYLDSKLMVTTLEDVQQMTYLTDAATEVLIFADDPALADALADRLSPAIEQAAGGEMEIMSWSRQGPLVQLLAGIKPVMGLILSILLLMAGMVIVNTMLMTVMERTHEYGMLSALGMRQGDLVKMIILEGVYIGLIGAITGGALGTAISIWLEQAGMDFTQAARGIELPFQGVIYPDWKWIYTLVSMASGAMVAALASTYPALRTRRLTPAQALKP